MGRWGIPVTPGFPSVRLLSALLAAVAVAAAMPGGSATATTPPGATCTVSVPILVVGGTPSGIAAAVSAARLGTQVMLTEGRPYLGGDLTGSMLNMFDMDFGPNGLHLARGVFMDIYDQLGMTFDVELAKHVFLQEVRREPNITLRLLTRPVHVVIEGNKVSAVMMKDLQTHDRFLVCAKRIVDATDDADVAAMAGVPYTLGREESGIDRAMMAATLVFQVDRIDWQAATAYVTSHSGPQAGHRGPKSTGGGIYRGNIWGYGKIMKTYRPTQPGVGTYDLNIGRQNDQSVLINGLLIYGVDGTDAASVADGMRRGRAELAPLIDFLRANAPGFEHAELVRAADYLYIRETRHIRGLYTLTVHDIVDSRVFWDAVGVASYPIDLHPYKPGEMNPYAAHRYIYTLPLRALVPEGISNLLVASRSFSATYEAAGSARVAPTTMEEGQAAGVAAVLSLRARVTVPQLTERPALVHDLQAGLYAQGAYLLPETMAAVGSGTTRPGDGLVQTLPAGPPSVIPGQATIK